jgi:valyl-tRNA synthetase
MLDNLANAKVEKNNDAHFVLANFNLYIKTNQAQVNYDKKRIKDRLAELTLEIKRSESLLNNKNFTSKAPADKFKHEQDKYESYVNEYKVLEGES